MKWSVSWAGGSRVGSSGLGLWLLTLAVPEAAAGSSQEEQQLLKLSAHSSLILLHLENLTQPINKGSSVPTVS